MGKNIFFAVLGLLVMLFSCNESQHPVRSDSTVVEIINEGRKYYFQNGQTSDYHHITTVNDHEVDFDDRSKSYKFINNVTYDTVQPLSNNSVSDQKIFEFVNFWTQEILNERRDDGYLNCIDWDNLFVGFDGRIETSGSFVVNHGRGSKSNYNDTDITFVYDSTRCLSTGDIKTTNGGLRNGKRILEVDGEGFRIEIALNEMDFFDEQDWFGLILYERELDSVARIMMEEREKKILSQ